MNEIRLLITTDNHLGFKENDCVRENDSFEALEEILGIPSENDVDAILILGDLFHESNTSLSSLNKCMSIMSRKIGRTKEYGNGLDLSKAEELKLDFNSIPTIIIHGNHDLPTGQYKNGSLDILENAGYIKYLGKFSNYENLNITPFVIQKGDVKIALYSLGYIKDVRLNYMLRNGKILFREENIGAHYKILMIHQNRHKGSRLGCPAKNCLDLSTLPKNFFDLILWGHEHQSYSEFITMEEFDTYIYQPGSSIPTSISKMEALDKYVGIIRFSSKEFKLHPIKLEFQRRMIIEDFTLKDLLGEREKSENTELRIVNLVTEKYQLTDSSVYKLLPLVRFRIFLEDGEELNSLELEMKLEHMVANKG